MRKLVYEINGIETTSYAKAKESGNAFKTKLVPIQEKELDEKDILLRDKRLEYFGLKGE